MSKKSGSSSKALGMGLSVPLHLRRPWPSGAPTRRCVLRGALWVMACAAVVPAARSATVRVEGQPFETELRVSDAELLLNGTGVRAVAWFKGFAAGLYLTSKTSSADQAVLMAGPKRLQMRMLQDVPAAEFSKAVHKGVLRNADPTAQTRLVERLALFEQQILALQRVRRGDVIDLDHEPGRGLTMRVNGTLRGAVISGDDFFAAVLRAFIGEQPYDKRLKAGLLNAAP